MHVFPGITAGASFTFSTADYQKDDLFPLATPADLYLPEKVYRLTHSSDSDESILGAYCHRAAPVSYDEIPQILAMCLKSIGQYGLPIEVNQIIRPPSPCKHQQQYWILGIRAVCKPKASSPSLLPPPAELPPLPKGRDFLRSSQAVNFEPEL